MSKHTNELRELSVDQLRARLEDAREELMNLRFQQASGELTDTSRVRITRRQIARILTILREHEVMIDMEGEA